MFHLPLSTSDPPSEEIVKRGDSHPHGQTWDVHNFLFIFGAGNAVSDIVYTDELKCLLRPVQAACLQYVWPHLQQLEW